MRLLSLALALWLVAADVRAVDSPSTVPTPGSGDFGWYLVFLAATLAGGIALVPDWVRRRRRARSIRGAVAVRVLKPASRSGGDGHPPLTRDTIPH
jgi:hypothetical protein